MGVNYLKEVEKTYCIEIKKDKETRKEHTKGLCNIRQEKKPTWETQDNQTEEAST